MLPTKGIRHKDYPSLSSTIRRTIYDFFERDRGNNGDRLLMSLRWFLFRRWKKQPDDSFTIDIERCPNGCGHGPIRFLSHDPGLVACPGCGSPVYLTDMFRLHERVDEETGASSIAAYVMSMLEQLVLVHLLYSVLAIKPALLREILFIKDGPLAFFGLVAPLYRPMRELVEHLLSQPGGPKGPTLRLAGLEKSGAFVEHAAAIQDSFPFGSFFVVGDKYIREYIIPGADVGAIFGQNTYYGQKVFFRAHTGEMYVATVPASRYLADPTPSDIPHIREILSLISELKCSMYDNALIPVALANKLVSLSDFPSQRILTAFAKRIAVP